MTINPDLWPHCQRPSLMKSSGLFVYCAVAWSGLQQSLAPVFHHSYCIILVFWLLTSDMDPIGPPLTHSSVRVTLRGAFPIYIILIKLHVIIRTSRRRDHLLQFFILRGWVWVCWGGGGVTKAAWSTSSVLLLILLRFSLFSFPLSLTSFPFLLLSRSFHLGWCDETSDNEWVLEILIGFSSSLAVPLLMGSWDLWSLRRGLLLNIQTSN